MSKDLAVWKGIEMHAKAQGLFVRYDVNQDGAVIVFFTAPEDGDLAQHQVGRVPGLTRAKGWLEGWSAARKDQKDRDLVRGFEPRPDCIP